MNTLNAGDTVLMVETGHFAALWHKMAQRLGLKPTFLAGDWRHGVDAAEIESHLRDDKAHQIKAVCIVHNETATGVSSNVKAVRDAIDRAAHPALLMVDTISSLGSVDYQHDAWGVDVTVGGSQKGLMLPPGLSFNAVSQKALAASKTATLPRSFWSWDEMIESNKTGFFPYTPATNLLYGLREAIQMLKEEGLANVFARHQRHAEATRRAVRAWGLEIVCQNPAEYSPVLTAVMMPAGHDADHFREVVLKNFDMSLGMGLSKLKGKVFRVGHLGDINDLTLVGALAGVEMSLSLAGVPHQKGGVAAAMEHLTASAATSTINKKAA
jgi:alanine-glyoxylate transaminase / serine-glyoxylate transaminase / serine-pyruvate transaminase